MAARLNLLSDTECRNGTSEGRAIRKLHDGGGLYLWIYQDSSKFWRLRYWIDGKEKSLSFGSYPDITLKEALSKRDTERRKIEQNLDPSAEKKAAKIKSKLAAANSFETGALEWYNKRAHTWVEHHARDVKWWLELVIPRGKTAGNYKFNEVVSMACRSRTGFDKSWKRFSHRRLDVIMKR